MIMCSKIRLAAILLSVTAAARGGETGGLRGFIVSRQRDLAAAMTSLGVQHLPAVEEFAATDWSMEGPGDQELKASILLLQCGLRSNPERAGTATGFIEVPLVVDFFVAGLRSSSADIIERSVEYLVRYVKRSDLASRTEGIEAALGGDLQGNRLLLLALAAGTGSADKVLGAKGRCDVSLALVGDTGAGSRLLESFEQADTYEGLVAAAKDLGWWGSDKALEALARGLQRDIAFQSAHHDTHGRLAVLSAIGRIEEDNPLFTHDSAVLGSTSDSTFALKVRPIKDYIAQVNAWAFVRYGIRPLSKEAWFQRYHNVPIVPPIAPEVDRE